MRVGPPQITRASAALGAGRMDVVRCRRRRGWRFAIFLAWHHGLCCPLRVAAALLPRRGVPPHLGPPPLLPLLGPPLQRPPVFPLRSVRNLATLPDHFPSPFHLNFSPTPTHCFAAPTQASNLDSLLVKGKDGAGAFSPLLLFLIFCPPSVPPLTALPVSRPQNSLSQKWTSSSTGGAKAACGP